MPNWTKLEIFDIFLRNFCPLLSRFCYVLEKKMGMRIPPPNFETFLTFSKFLDETVKSLSVK